MKIEYDNQEPLRESFVVIPEDVHETLFLRIAKQTKTTFTIGEERNGKVQLLLNIDGEPQPIPLFDFFTLAISEKVYELEDGIRFESIGEIITIHPHEKEFTVRSKKYLALKTNLYVLRDNAYCIGRIYSCTEYPGETIYEYFCRQVLSNTFFIEE